MCQSLLLYPSNKPSERPLTASEPSYSRSTKAISSRSGRDAQRNYPLLVYRVALRHGGLRPSLPGADADQVAVYLEHQHQFGVAYHVEGMFLKW